MSVSSSISIPDIQFVVGSVIASPSSDTVVAVIPSFGAVARISLESFSVAGAEAGIIEPEEMSFGQSYKNDKFKGDFPAEEVDTEAMNDITREELRSTLSAIEERMEKRIDRLAEESGRHANDYRRELTLRDEAFRREQELRDSAWDGRISGFLAAQEERDRTVALLMEQSKDAVQRAEATTATAASTAASVKSNYWAAVAVQLLSVAAILVAAYFANQTSVIGIGQLMKSEPSPPPAEIRIEHVAPSHAPASPSPPPQEATPE
ncbi:hypothetical protein QAO71_10590 [Halopseudomonas sp. SMJS2]|uniref:hypothetical protein n=1 Tax=Halopseudomonas sp. SMJS2 TaxID=3041098 RepID=UPI0024531B1B|nr:hypothetical protein [Halopseudomonas sp. SMJS2]WGK60540.1 hypothetical protein QAO71_10590 [Halopseudomonas sp. SMJS2]